MNKVILVSIDGMRPDGVSQCGNPYVEEMKKKGSYTLTAQTVNPSVTLPCHMSMFHSVTPERHVLRMGAAARCYASGVPHVGNLHQRLFR